ncbi:hypothetical protein SOP91_00110 (plasmid) [Enterobacter hormaechei]|uniref:hypothetical protein n=1 Tax=Enterobacter hormaechei TaxID=158836 RepID=UPI002B4C041F|nr:hypothetical protein [Enterobacter hormaechei]WRM07113.1 hypothetical protein SOP91_00110 [Enterobacter hormaechei]
MTSSAKDLKKALLVQQISQRTPFKTEEIALLMTAGEPMAVLFDLMFDQVSGLQETNLNLADSNQKLQQRADIASMKAQEYFVRLRDGKLLNQGETF